MTQTKQPPAIPGRFRTPPTKRLMKSMRPMICGRWLKLKGGANFTIARRFGLTNLNVLAFVAAALVGRRRYGPASRPPLIPSILSGDLGLLTLVGRLHRVTLRLILMLLPARSISVQTVMTSGCGR